jgi:hypothetical protein
MATNIIIDESTANSLRDLAASLGFYIKRGPGTREKIGNIKALLDRLGQVYGESPEVVQAMLQILVNWREKDAPNARPWVNLVCNHTWLSDADKVPDVCPVCGDASGQIRPVPDERRVHGDSFQPYDERTAWGQMANRVLSSAAQERFLQKQEGQ